MTKWPFSLITLGAILCLLIVIIGLGSYFLWGGVNG